MRKVFLLSREIFFAFRSFLWRPFQRLAPNVENLTRQFFVRNKPPKFSRCLLSWHLVPQHFDKNRVSLPSRCLQLRQPLFPACKILAPQLVNLVLRAQPQFAEDT